MTRIAAAVLEQLRELGDRAEASTREQLLNIALVHVLEKVEEIAGCTHDQMRTYSAGDRVWCEGCGAKLIGSTAVLPVAVAVLRTNVDQLRAALGILPAQQGPAGTWKPKDEGHA